MTRLLLLLSLLLSLLAPTAFAFPSGRMDGWCALGGQTVQLPGAYPPSTTKVLRTYPQCIVDVYISGTTTHATIYSNAIGGALANPFNASTSAYWYFYAADGAYDVRISGGGLVAPFTFTAKYINTSSGGGGGGGAPTTALYWLGAPNGSLASAYDLSALSTGLVKNTGGVPSAASAADLPTHASRHQFGGNDIVGTATPAANALVMSGAGGKIASGWIPDTAVSAGTWGSATQVPQFTVGTDGRIVAVNNQTITATPSGTAGGDLTSTYPNPALVATGVAAGIYGASNVVPILTIDAKGRVTNATSVSVQATGAVGGSLTGNLPNPTLSTTGITPGTYGDNTGVTVSVPKFTVNSEGRITAVSLMSTQYVGTTASFGGDVTGTYNAINVSKINGTSLAGLGTGVLKLTTGTPSLAANTDIATLFGCGGDSTKFLRGDGGCAVIAGSGTVTNSGTLTNNTLMGGNGGTQIKSVDLIGVISTSGSLVTTFTEGVTGSGAIVKAYGATLDSPAMINLSTSDIFDYYTGSKVLRVQASASGAVNYFRMSAGLSGNEIGLGAAGADANVSMSLSAQGTGKVKFASLAMLGIPGGTAGQVLTTDGAMGHSWTTVSGTGTVTNVATAFPISGGAITTTGTISCPTCNYSSAVVTANQLVTGADGARGVQGLGSLGTTTQVLHGNAAGAPTWGQIVNGDIANGTIDLTTKVQFALNVANGGTGLASGTSGGIPYFNGTTSIASTAALTANKPIIGGGAGVAPSSANTSGNTTTFVTTTGTQTAGNCVKIDASGNHVADTGPCTTSSISGSGTTGQVAVFSASTTLSSTAIASTSSLTASAIVKTGTNKEILAYDYGAQAYNVNAYGAVGDGSTNDATAIQAAINACQNATTGAGGGVVLFPNREYAITSALTVGNGSSGGASTLRPCRLIGSGVAYPKAGDVLNSTLAGTKLKWTGGNQGSTTVMISFLGPMVGGGLEHIYIDAQAATNVRALLLQQTELFKGQQISIANSSSGPAVHFKPIRAIGDASSCRNIIDGLYVNSPGTGGEGILFDDFASTSDNCSVTLRSVVSYGHTYGMKVIGADNLQIQRAELQTLDTYSTGTVSTSGTCPCTNITGAATVWTGAMSGYPMVIGGVEYTFTYVSATTGTVSPAIPTTTSSAAYLLYLGAGLVFEQSAHDAAFPHENTFISLTTTTGVHGVTGTAKPNNFLDYKIGDCAFTLTKTCDPTRGISGGTVPVVIATTGRFFNYQAAYQGTDENAVAFAIHNIMGSQNGAGVMQFWRQDDPRFQLKAHYTDGMTFSVKNGGGSMTDKWRFSPDGYMGTVTLAASTSNTLCYNTSVLTGYNTLATCSSLSRYKTDIMPLEDALSTVRALTPVAYTSLTSGRRELGLIAEQVETVEPRIATYDGSGLTGVDYGHLSAIAVRAIQQLEERVQKLEEELAKKSKSNRLPIPLAGDAIPVVLR